LSGKVIGYWIFGEVKVTSTAKVDLYQFKVWRHLCTTPDQVLKSMSSRGDTERPQFGHKSSKHFWKSLFYFQTIFPSEICYKQFEMFLSNVYKIQFEKIDCTEEKINWQTLTHFWNYLSTQSFVALTRQFRKMIAIIMKWRTILGRSIWSFFFQTNFWKKNSPCKVCYTLNIFAHNIAIKRYCAPQWSKTSNYVHLIINLFWCSQIWEIAHPIKIDQNYNNFDATHF